MPPKRRADTEAAVLAAVERLLVSGASFTELSVQRIADEANIARSTFYLSFRDKTDVLTRLIGSLKDEVFAAGQGWRIDGPHGGRDGLAAIFIRQLAYYRERAPLVNAVNEVIAYDRTLRSEGRRFLARFTERTIARLRDEQRAGRLAPEVDPVAAGQVLTWTGGQAIAQQVAIGDCRDDAKFATALADLQWFGTYRTPRPLP